MKKIVGYLKDFISLADKKVLIFSTLFTALLVFINYRYQLNGAINRLPVGWQYLAWYGVFLIAFAVGFWLQRFDKTIPSFQRHTCFWMLLFLAPAIFSWKMTYRVHFFFSADYLKTEYWNAVVYWPLKVFVITAVLFVIHRVFDKEKPFYGVSAINFTARPYLLMLLIMIPLVAAASVQHDFLSMYPRMQNIEYLLQPNRGWHKLLYELSYGSDFFSIELFFRGFLVLAFARYAGSGSILPMAIFYCAIHFGKPLGECVSSYFGGIILGVISYHTRTILGGFFVHVGIAWLMELGGYLGKSYL
jgi:hypothetical protein